MQRTKLLGAVLLIAATAATGAPASADDQADARTAARIDRPTATKMHPVKKRSFRKKMLRKALRRQPQSGRRLSSTDMSDWDVLRSGSVLVATPPELEVKAIDGAAGFASVDITVDASELLDDLDSDDFGDADVQDVEPGTSALAGIDQVQGAGMKTRVMDDCPVLENGSGWMMPCVPVSRSKKKVAGKYLWALYHEAMFKSKGASVMRKARVRAVPAKKDHDYKTVGFDPSADLDQGNCSSISLGVGFGAASVGYSSEICDRWDIGGNRGPGAFDNTWFGKAWRTERSVAYAIMIKTDRKKGVRWRTDNDWCTGGTGVLSGVCRNW